MTLTLYNLLLLLTTPLWLIYLAWHPRTKGTLAARLGAVTPPPQTTGGIWVHAVSVGELVAATPLLLALHERKTPTVLTTATRAAQDMAHQKFTGWDNLFITYLPVDAPWVLRRFLGRTRPTRLVIFETELWPNLLTLAKNRGVRCFWFNGRVSDRMLAQKGFVRALNALALDRFDAIVMQSPEQLARLKTFYDPGKRATRCGNAKLDVSPPPCPRDVFDVAQTWKGPCEVVLMLGSTHPKEEETFLHIAKNQHQWENQCHVIVVPRHTERVAEVRELAEKMGFWTVLRSNLATAGPKPEGKRACMVVDTTGELASLYEAADVAVVGGSFINRGGHNVLEPAFWGVPVYVGPHTQNFTEWVAWLKELGMLKQVDQLEMLEREWINLFRHNEQLGRWRQDNQNKLAPHRGITAEHLRLLNLVDD